MNDNKEFQAEAQARVDQLNEALASAPEVLTGAELVGDYPLSDYALETQKDGNDEVSISYGGPTVYFKFNSEREGYVIHSWDSEEGQAQLNPAVAAKLYRFYA